MMKIVRPGLLIALGFVIGVIAYKGWGNATDRQVKQIDTTLARPVYAAQNNASTDQWLSDNRANAITRAVKKVSPAVLSINVRKIREYVQRNPFSNDPFLRRFFPEIFGDRVLREPVQSIGSGFIISEDGYILTNEHVVSEENVADIKITVVTGHGEEYEAELIGSDRLLDVALLKINEENLPFIPFGDSDDLRIGEWAIAFGNPFGLFMKHDPSVTVGVVSAVDRDFRPQDERVYQDMIQTDASINSGNSGGPLCNADGEVIGMNTFIYTGDWRNSGSIGIGFAIPINRIKQLVNDLKENRGVDRDIWIGLHVENLTPFLARQLGYDSTDGVVVMRVDRRSPAAAAGIEPGDIITRINGQSIRNHRDANEIILTAAVKVGDKLKISIRRDNKELETVLVLKKRPQ